MIKIQVMKNPEQDTIIVSGHSGYDVEGHDIVCAGVSSIVITTINAIIRYKNDLIEYESKSGYVKMVVKHDKIADLLIENMISLLKEMEEKYKKYIKVN